MDVREYFKEVVAEAVGKALRTIVCDARTGIFVCCNIPREWFSRNGKYRRLLDPAYIDGLEEDALKQELAWFIVDCYRQR